MQRHLSRIAVASALVCYLVVPAVAQGPKSDALAPAQIKALPAGEVSTVPDGTTVSLTLPRSYESFKLAGVKPLFNAMSDFQQSLWMDKVARRRLIELLGDDTVRYEIEPPPAVKTAGFKSAHVYRNADGVYVNAELIELGFGVTDPNYKGKHRETLLAAQEKARKAKVGMWADKQTVDAIIAEFRANDEGDARRRKANSRRIIVNYERATVVTPGETLLLHGDPDELIFVATDITSYEDMCKYIRAKDFDGLKAQVKAGVILNVQEDTPVRYLEYKKYVAPVAAEVRILEGEHAGKEVWAVNIYLYRKREVRVKKR
jgi:endonuclease YncB( thermonuclease family)